MKKEDLENEMTHALANQTQGLLYLLITQKKRKNYEFYNEKRKERKERMESPQ